MEDYSPIRVDYRSKKMSVTIRELTVPLQGVIDDNTTCLPIFAAKLSGLMKRGVVSHCIQMSIPTIDFDCPSIGSVNSVEEVIPTPKPVQTLLQKYEHLFDEPKSLPPRRSADHTIPLVLGAQPVKVRPYRYSPIQKTEIENQLKQMLEQGVIRPSQSSFASPILLVRKKDGIGVFVLTVGTLMLLQSRTNIQCLW